MTAYHQQPPLGHGGNRSCHGIVAAWRAGVEYGTRFGRLLLGADAALELFGDVQLCDVIRFRDQLAATLDHDVIVEVVPDRKLFPAHNAIWTNESWREMCRRHEEQNR